MKLNNENLFMYLIRAVRLEMLTEGPTEEESAVLEKHFAYLQDLVKHGVVFLAGRTQNNDETAFGLVILRVESEEEARRIMNSDPAVREAVMRAELYPYRIALLGKCD